MFSPLNTNCAFSRNIPQKTNVISQINFTQENKIELNNDLIQNNIKRSRHKANTFNSNNSIDISSSLYLKFTPPISKTCKSKLPKIKTLKETGIITTPGIKIISFNKESKEITSTPFIKKETRGIIQFEKLSKRKDLFMLNNSPSGADYNSKFGNSKKSFDCMI